MRREDVKLQKEINCNELLKKKNVVAVGVGHKVQRGIKTDETCVVVSVNKKVSVGTLSKKDLVPLVLGTGSRAVRTDVVEVGEIKAQERVSRERPARGGTSIGHFAITAGTLGCLVKSPEGEVFILSNNHVLANSNDAEISDTIYQPGPYDGGIPKENVIGTLADFVPISFDAGTGNAFLDLILGLLCRFFGIFCREPSETNTVDAALASPSDGAVTTEIADIGPPNGSAEGQLGDKVRKSGRTTELTTGTIDQTDVTVDVQYGAGKLARFENQLLTGAMSKGGDSGSVLVNEQDQVVGLLFAGSDQVTIYNPIRAVLDQLEVEIA